MSAAWVCPTHGDGWLVVERGFYRCDNVTDGFPCNAVSGFGTPARALPPTIRRSPRWVTVSNGLSFVALAILAAGFGQPLGILGALAGLVFMVLADQAWAIAMDWRDLAYDVMAELDESTTSERIA